MGVFKNLRRFLTRLPGEARKLRGIVSEPDFGSGSEPSNNESTGAGMQKTPLPAPGLPREAQSEAHRRGKLFLKKVIFIFNTRGVGLIEARFTTGCKIQLYQNCFKNVQTQTFQSANLSFFKKEIFGLVKLRRSLDRIHSMCYFRCTS
jgi:hypothetical protein